jgi:hypothetical protein
MASHYLRKYGVETTLNFELYLLDGTALVTNAVSATGDINLQRDEGSTEVLDADTFVDEGQSYSLALSAVEMTAGRIIIHIVDQSSPQIWLDKVLIVETYGHASAQHPFDLGTALTSTGIADQVWNETKSDHVTSGSTGEALTNTLQVLSGKWEITGNQLIMYASDGSTALYTFDLTNNAGSPASRLVYKRTPA